MIKFSIITVCLNADTDLIDTVTNTLGQTYENFEIVVKDGFSKDGSIEKLPKDSRIRIIQKADTGIYDAMNQGIAVATGDYLIFMNAGDGFYERETLAKLEKEISKSCSDFYYGHSYNLRFKSTDIVPPKINKMFCFRSMVCHQATVYKADMLKRRAYDTSFRISADNERMVYAFVREQASFKYVPIVVSLFKSRGLCSSIQGNVENEEEKKRIKKKHFTLFERLIFSTLLFFTFPTIRKKISTNITLSKYYRMVINVIYKTGTE